MFCSVSAQQKLLPFPLSSTSPIAYSTSRSRDVELSNERPGWRLMAPSSHLKYVRRPARLMGPLLRMFTGGEKWIPIPAPSSLLFIPASLQTAAVYKFSLFTSSSAYAAAPKAERNESHSTAVTSCTHIIASQPLAKFPLPHRTWQQLFSLSLYVLGWAAQQQLSAEVLATDEHWKIKNSKQFKVKTSYSQTVKKIVRFTS